jgi:hypothetical protein
LRGRAPSLCQFAVPGEQAQISDLIAPKTHPTPESLLGFQPAKDTCRVSQLNAPEFWNGGEVAGAGFVLKSLAEDNGAFGHRRIYRKASWGILDNNELGDVTRHDFQKRAPEVRVFSEFSRRWKKRPRRRGRRRVAAFDVSGLCPIEGQRIGRI